MLKLRCFACTGVLMLSSAGVAGSELGYRTEGYPAIQTSTKSTRSSDGGHRHFTKPAYNNSSTHQPYYRSYHAHKDAIRRGEYNYGVPWGLAYPGVSYVGRHQPYPSLHGPLLHGPVSSFPHASSSYPLEHTAASPPVRQLLKTLDGQCFEVQRNNKGEELRTELNAEQCNW